MENVSFSLGRGEAMGLVGGVRVRKDFRSSLPAPSGA